MLERGWSADNIAFGMGGALLQKLDRDTFKYAMKANEAVINGTAVPVFKAPFGDPGKASKKGRQAVVWDYQFQDYFSVAEEQYPDNLLKEVWRAGEFKREYTLDDVRKLASQAS